MNRIAIILAISCGIWLAAPGQDIVINRASFNSEQSDFSPVPFQEGIVFCSNRREKILSSDVDSLRRFYTDLYYTQKIEGEYLPPQLFSKELTGWLNEGPATFSEDFKTIYYTANIDPGNVRNKNKIKEYKLGIFRSDWTGEIWGEPVAFRYNDKKTNIAHPAISSGDSMLFFTSTMKNGFGGADLYMSEWRDSMWSEPVNMGPEINTPGNELFPFFDQSQRLFFSSDGRDVENGMDIYMCQMVDTTWSIPVRLQEPINSVWDDFGYVHDRFGQHGFVCSDRDSETDEIFEFTLDFPEFAECDENHKPIYCYQIEEARISNLDSSLMFYEWDLGDGNNAYGNKVKYCYADTGTYHVVLNVIERETGRVFYKLAEGDINIQKFDRPHISGPTYARTNRAAVFTGADSEISSFVPEEFYWDMGDGNTYVGTQISHKFEEPGEYTVALGAVSRADRQGNRQKKCAFLKVQVYDGIKWIQEDKFEFEKIYLDRLHPIESPNMEPVVSIGWKIVVASSYERMPYSSPQFAMVRSQLHEQYDEETGLYSYTLGPTRSAEELIPAFRALSDAGIDGIEVTTEECREFVQLAPVQVEQIYMENGVRVVALSTTRMPFLGYEFTRMGVELVESFNDLSGMYSYTSETVEDASAILEVFDSLEESGLKFESVDTQSDLQLEETYVPGEMARVKATIGRRLPLTYPSILDLDVIFDEKVNGDSTMFSYRSTETMNPMAVVQAFEDMRADGLEVHHVEIIPLSPQNNEPDAVEDEPLQTAPSIVIKVIARSGDRIPFNSPRFAEVLGEITELRNYDTGEYYYSILPTSREKKNLEQQSELADSEIPSLGIISMKMEQFELERVKTGRYIPTGSATALNREFRGLEDIHFEFDSHLIKEESFGNLDYIAAILMLEPKFLLHIHAHTCSLGTETYNFRLSQRRAESVLRYLSTKGISSAQLTPLGFGDTQPDRSNTTEEGRIQNRRVEFIIDMDGKTKFESQ